MHLAKKSAEQRHKEQPVGGHKTNKHYYGT